MGEQEVAYRFKVENGKITGAQMSNFGDQPITAGKFNGDEFEFVVERESFGNIQKITSKGKIEGDTIVYSLCQYGRAEVGEWGPLVSGNLWRTTFDIRDQWQASGSVNRSRPHTRRRGIGTIRTCWRWATARHDGDRVSDAFQLVGDAGRSADCGQRFAKHECGNSGDTY